MKILKYPLKGQSVLVIHFKAKIIYVDTIQSNLKTNELIDTAAKWLNISSDELLSAEYTLEVLSS